MPWTLQSMPNLSSTPECLHVHDSCTQNLTCWWTHCYMYDGAQVVLVLGMNQKHTWPCSMGLEVNFTHTHTYHVPDWRERELLFLDTDLVISTFPKVFFIGWQKCHQCSYDINLWEKLLAGCQQWNFYSSQNWPGILQARSHWARGQRNRLYAQPSTDSILFS